jgi:hypothetical protein
MCDNSQLNVYSQPQWRYLECATRLELILRYVQPCFMTPDSGKTTHLILERLNSGLTHGHVAVETEDLANDQKELRNALYTTGSCIVYYR